MDLPEAGPGQEGPHPLPGVLVDGVAVADPLVAPGELVSIEGAAVRGQNLWWWLVATVAACLVVEMTALALPGLNAARS